MKVVLQNNLISIQTGFKALKTTWMNEFLNLHAQDMLFLPKAVLVFFNITYFEQREKFLSDLSQYYCQKYELAGSFFERSLLRCSNQPIKIEFDNLEEPQNVAVELYARNTREVEISLYAANSWVMAYLTSQLDPYILEHSDTQLLVDVSEMRAKSRLERALNKRHILHYSIQYTYDATFMQRLYAEYAGFEFEADDHEKIEEMMHYYTVLECPVGSSQDALKKSYRKLVKIYHPDKVYQENNDIVHHYTQKFQLLQEAYTALRIVS